MQKRIEDSAGVAITLELDNDQREDIDVLCSLAVRSPVW